MVSATGPISGTATTTFTDAVTSTIEQCENDNGNTNAVQNCNWISGR